ncbi:MAG: hypothetical protein ABW007_02205 [Chitinophagaceae bacterium]
MNKRDQHTEINIIIDRLVIEGMDLTIRDRQLLQQTIAAKLREHFINNNGDTPVPDLSYTSTISAGTIHLTEREAGAASIGADIAGSVYKGLNKET